MNEDESVQGGPQRPPWIAFSIVAAVALGIVVAFFIAEKQEAEQRQLLQEHRAAQLKAERGTACHSLMRASEQLESGDRKGSRESILEAERKAIRALDTSGIAFGKPERLALFLAEELRAEDRGETSDETDRLEEAVDSCERLRT